MTTIRFGLSAVCVKRGAVALGDGDDKVVVNVAANEYT
jgi:hypothetical protein